MGAVAAEILVVGPLRYYTIVIDMHCHAYEYYYH